MSFPDPETKLFEFDCTSWDVFLVSLYCVYNTCSDIQCINFLLFKTFCKVVKFEPLLHEIEKCDKILSLFKVLLHLHSLKTAHFTLSFLSFFEGQCFFFLMNGYSVKYSLQQFVEICNISKNTLVLVHIFKIKNSEK